MISLKTAKILALVTFLIGTILFIVQFIFGEGIGITGLGLMFIVVAFLVNTVMFLIAFIDLLRTDHLESFYVMCILLINLPIAIGYAYLIIEKIGF